MRKMKPPQMMRRGGKMPKMGKTMPTDEHPMKKGGKDMALLKRTKMK